MPTRVRLQSFTISLPTKEYEVFVAAAEILRRLMGRKAPTLLVLVQHNLRGRDAKGVADDYLDFIGWPQAEGRAVLLRRQEFSPLRPRFRRLKESPAPADPSRN